MACRRFLVRGRVQGVWFRASTRQQAERLGLTGQAVNLTDGRVEVIACGPEAMLDDLAAWLWQGPELARVDHVSIEEVAPRHFSGFKTG
jgi:acylphosphatase